MITLRVAAGGALVLALSISISNAGPCAGAIDAMQARIDAKLDRVIERKS